MMIENMDITELQIAEYDNEENCIMHFFKIKNNWLNKQIRDMGYSSIEKFIEEYTSQESSEIYSHALLENAIIDENYSK